jgi:hypothetical protein
MSPNTAVLPLPASPPATPPPPPPLDLANPPALDIPPADPKAKRNGKIAHLTKEQRDTINRLFDDGATYETVAQKMAEQGVSLNLTNIHGWFHGGYQDELQHRERLALIRDTQDHLLDLALKNNATQIPSVGLQIAVTQLSQQLTEITTTAHKEQFEKDTGQYLRMLNTLARLSKSLLALQQYHDESARAQAKNAQSSPVSAEAQRTAFLDASDDLFGIKSHLRLQAEAAAAAPAGAPEPQTTPATPASDSPLPSASANLPSPPPAPVSPLKSEISDPNSSPAAPQVSAPSLPSAIANLPFPAPATLPPSDAPTNKQHDAPAAHGPEPATLTHSAHESALCTLHSSLTTSPEHCLECGTELPPLLPTGGRYYQHCQTCNVPLPPPGTCREPSLEHCPSCDAALPRPRPDGTRPDQRCHRCGDFLPPPP